MDPSYFHYLQAFKSPYGEPIPRNHGGAVESIPQPKTTTNVAPILRNEWDIRPQEIGALADLRPRLIARRDPSLDEEGLPAYRFDVILRGDGETPFLLD